MNSVGYVFKKAMADITGRDVFTAILIKISPFYRYLNIFV